jgi:hypothetical protein
MDSGQYLGLHRAAVTSHKCGITIGTATMRKLEKGDCTFLCWGSHFDRCVLPGGLVLELSCREVDGLTKTFKKVSIICGWKIRLSQEYSISGPA